MILSHAKISPRLRTFHSGGEAPVDPAALKVRRTRLFLVEDEKHLRGILVRWLTGRGYDVRSAENGEAAWQSLRGEPFDLLITDLEMPQLNGIGLLRRLRNASFFQPAILISGNLPAITPEKEKWVFPGTIVAKPFPFSVLIIAIEAMLVSASHWHPIRKRSGV
ncbi:MAG: response regulator [Opitutales bacterium]|nr:response regulator [Opitutales bacterium]MCH8541849.1 response regulator [Opitutales bacterium]